jgi:hypothetical protein
MTATQSKLLAATVLIVLALLGLNKETMIRGDQGSSAALAGAPADFIFSRDFSRQPGQPLTRRVATPHRHYWLPARPAQVVNN